MGTSRTGGMSPVIGMFSERADMEGPTLAVGSTLQTACHPVGKEGKKNSTRKRCFSVPQLLLLPVPLQFLWPFSMDLIPATLQEASRPVITGLDC